MRFGEKLRQERLKAGLTQEELSEQLGVTCRTLQNYESGTVYPKKRELYTTLATFFHTDVNYWLSEAPEYFGISRTMGREEVQDLASQVSCLLYSCELAEADLDDFMRTIQGAYRAAKDKNKNMSR